MAEIVKNEQGFRVIKMSAEEAIHKCNFGMYSVRIYTTILLCDDCNKCINEEKEVYYVAVLNSLLCKKCYDNWYARARRYEEDAEYEERHFRNYANALRLKL